MNWIDPNVRCSAGMSARCGHYVAFAKLKGTDDGTGERLHTIASMLSVHPLSKLTPTSNCARTPVGKEVWVELNDAVAVVSPPPIHAERETRSGKSVLLWYSRRPI